MTAIVIDSSEIRSFGHRTVNPSDFVELSEKIRRAARAVEKEWNNFSDEDREQLKSLAYDLIEPHKGPSLLWFKIWAQVYMIRIKATGQEKPFKDCIQALDCLVDNILEAVEQEHPYYKQVLSDTLEELSSNPGIGEPVDAERRKWLEQISDKALREI